MATNYRNLPAGDLADVNHYGEIAPHWVEKLGGVQAAAERLLPDYPGATLVTMIGAILECLALQDVGDREAIEALRREAIEAGDDGQVQLCDRSLDGDREATVLCVDTLLDTHVKRVSEVVDAINDPAASEWRAINTASIEAVQDYAENGMQMILTAAEAKAVHAILTGRQR